MHVDIYSDGSRLDIAGPVGWACEVSHAGQRWRASGILRSPSIVLAEAYAAARGIELALAHRATAFDLFVDAQLVLDLLAGKAPHLLVADPMLAQCIDQVQGWCAEHPIRLHKVKSHRHGCSGNAWADAEARGVLERARQ